MLEHNAECTHGCCATVHRLPSIVHRRKKLSCCLLFSEPPGVMHGEAFLCAHATHSFDNIFFRSCQSSPKAQEKTATIQYTHDTLFPENNTVMNKNAQGFEHSTKICQHEKNVDKFSLRCQAKVSLANKPRRCRPPRLPRFHHQRLQLHRMHQFNLPTVQGN